MASSYFLLSEGLLGLVVLTCALLLVYYLYRGRGLPPGPWGLPVVGFLPWLDPERPHLTLAELAQDYGPICSLRLGEVTAVLLSHPSLVKEALSKEIFTGRAPLWLTHGLMNNNGLIAVEGEKWREQRKFVVTCLKNLGAVKMGGRREDMQRRILVAVREANVMLAREMEEEGSVDPHRPLAHTIGNFINGLVFGRTFAAEDETWLWLQTLAEEGVKLVGVSGVINFIPLLRYLPKYSRILRFVKEGQLKTHEVYRQLAREVEAAGGGESVLAMYLEAMRLGKGRYFTEEQMVHLLADLFGAGLDTSLATLRWMLLYLAINPQVQEIAYEEIDSCLGKRREPNLDDLPKCPFTEATILETMRIRPVVPLGIPHGTLADTTLMGYRIPAGTMIMVNHWAIHHDKDHWKDPEVFNPQRFISSEGQVKKSEYFNPFQNGKRVCIGEELTRMVLFLFLAGILREFVLEPDGDPGLALEGTSGITNSPGHHRLRLLKRNPGRRLEKVSIRREESEE